MIIDFLTVLVILYSSIFKLRGLCIAQCRIWKMYAPGQHWFYVHLKNCY